MVKLFQHVLFSRVLERVNDQEIRGGKSVDTIRDSCYHKEKGAEKTWEGWGQHTRQTLEKSPTSKLYTTWAHILSDRNKFAPRGEGENSGVQCPRRFSCFFWWSLAPDLRFSLGQTNTRRVFRYTGKGFYLE